MLKKENLDEPKERNIYWTPGIYSSLLAFTLNIFEGDSDQFSRLRIGGLEYLAIYKVEQSTKRGELALLRYRTDESAQSHGWR